MAEKEIRGDSGTAPEGRRKSNFSIFRLLHRLRRQFLSRGSFSRFLLTVMSGTFVAQLITTLLAPVLTRIFTPADYGHYGVFWSIATIALLFATGRFEVAILLPKEERGGLNLAKAAMAAALATSALGLVLLLAFPGSANRLLQLPQQARWLLLLPLTILLWALNQTFFYLANRRKLYSQIATNRIVSAVTASLASIGLGLAGWKIWGLIAGQMLGLAAGAVVMGISLAGWYRSLPAASPGEPSWAATAREYGRYSLHSVPSGVFNTLAHQLPILLLGPFFGAKTAGLYYLSYRIVNLPVTLFSGSLNTVFYKYSMDNIENQEKVKQSMEKSVSYLLLIALVPCLALLFFGPRIFGLAFGSEWSRAGRYAQVMVPLFLFRFLSSPLTVFFQKGLTLLLLRWQFSLFACIALALAVGKLSRSAFVTVSCISFLGSLCYLWLLQINFRLTGSSLRNIPKTILQIFRELRHD